jgi:uncharacterized membrane protein YhaH (DUF805 family)
MDLFTRFEGRIGRGRFLLGVLALLVPALVLGILTTPLQFVGSGGAWTGVILSLIFLYPALALIVKRLHDRGRPALPWAAIYVVPGVAFNLMQATGIGFTHIRFGDLMLVEPNGLGLIATSLAFIAAVVGFIDLCLLRGERDANQWGPAAVAR